MYGEYQHSVDAKGRMFLPAKFRIELGEKVFLSRSLDNCITIFPEKEWEMYVERLSASKEVSSRHAKRIFTASAVETDVDCQGRIVLPAHIREKYNFGKIVTVIGVGARAEIWNTEEFENYKNSVTNEQMEAELIALGL